MKISEKAGQRAQEQIGGTKNTAIGQSVNK